MKSFRQLLQWKTRRPRHMPGEELLEGTNIDQWIRGCNHDAVKKTPPMDTDKHG
jgi:hypothetical protein